MSRKIEYSTRKEVKLPHSDKTGYGKWKAKAGDFITYREPYTNGSDGRRFARVIGVITKTDNDGPSGVGHLLVLAISDDGTFGYERWVAPGDVRECKPPEHAGTFLTWLLDATPAAMHLYIRDDLATRQAATYSTTPTATRAPASSPIGWQVVETGSDDPPEGMTSYEVFSLAYVLAWLAAHPAERARWRLLPIYAGEVEEATDRTAEEFTG